jgi:hypothetical protein
VEWVGWGGGFCAPSSVFVCQGKEEMPTAPVDPNGPQNHGEETPARAIAAIIRAKSEEAKLLSQRELFRALTERNLLPPEVDQRQELFEARIEEAMEENADLVKLQAPGEEPFFFSSRHMTEPYARILLGKEADPMLLIAEVVRENSAIYPRPVPLRMFQQTPFDLTEDEIQSCLERMAGQEETQDIRQTTTSIGTVFLFSIRHLDPDYGSMLAEWLDVGQANNP